MTEQLHTKQFYYEEGERARENGERMRDNPYATGEDNYAPWMWSFGWQDKLAEQTDWLKEKVDKLNIDMDDDWRRMLRQKK